MVEHLRPYQFQKGMEKTGGRKPGARNKLSHAFLEAFAADFEAHGVEAIRIVRMERPAEYLKVAAYLMPKTFEGDIPSLTVVYTGVPRAGDIGPYPDRPPSIPSATLQGIASLPREDD